MSEYYKISGERLTGIAEQARRLGNVSGKLNPAQIENALSNATTGASLPIAEETTFGYVKTTETVTEKAPEGKCWYNGVLLPEIPADVLASYPYAWIRKHTTNGEYQLIFSASGFYFNGSSAVSDKNSVNNPKYVLPITDGTVWTVASDSEGYSSWTVDDDRPCMWSNHNIPSGSATATAIYFKGSEPVTELTETTTKHVPVERESNYSITDDSLNEIAKRTQEMAGTSRLLTPEDIIYWLGRVMFVPQGWIRSGTVIELDTDVAATAILPKVEKATFDAQCSLNLLFNTSATGALQEA